MSSTFDFESVDEALKTIQGPTYDEVHRILYGRPHAELEISKEALEIASKNNFDMRAYEITAEPEQLRAPRKVRVAAIQFATVLPTTAPIEEQRKAIHHKVATMIDAAAAAGANIVCMHELWTMPFAFCTRERLPWTEFAESAEHGPSTKFLSQLAAKYNIVIVSSILERDESKDDVLWNAAVVISNSGKVIGKSRKNHIPRIGDFSESTYYMESTIGHPVFETAYGKIAINVCYGRHHPQNWMMYALNGAEIIFNPCAEVVENLSEPMWAIEARSAAIANHCFTVPINRVGRESFPNEFTSGDGRTAHKEIGQFYGSAYVAAPDGSRTPGLSRTKDGVLIAEIDLNLCRQTKDHLCFRMTQRLDLYAKSITAAADPNYKPDIHREK
ncbi:hydrolase, carbon-nitrogen family [Ancylostoma caninum]|uniref:Beta-ureidopropionase n=1 Tax=Ancylostoma caninum TaxID=29170 RepID=A0A368G195_ANCCA|nr:hydrolase, carbon-nitrogen family [Ancylostoma caninum]